MKNLPVNNYITIPSSELEITTSRSGGPGGQHVNKTDTRVTVRWNVRDTNALDQAQKERVLQNLQARLTNEGDLLVNSSASRSQLQNRNMALEYLAQLVRKALYIPKKRKPMQVPKSAQEARLRAKVQRSMLKKMRKKIYE